MANKYLDLLGTTLSSFGIGPKATRATLDTSAITAPRTHTLPDASGAVALLSQCATAAQGAKADSAVQPNAAINALSGVNTGDQNLSGLMPKAGGHFSGPFFVDDDGADTAIRFMASDGATYRGLIGVASVAGKIITDSASGDLVLRPIGGSWTRIATGTATTAFAFGTDARFWRAHANGSGGGYTMPRIFVQSPDPGGNASDGDLWAW